MSTTKAPPSPEVLIPGLPNDVALNCLVRVPRWHHPVLAAVSKPMRSLLSSPHFFSLRSHLNSTQNILYVSITPEDYKQPHNFFAIHPKPVSNSTINDDWKSFLLLAPTPLFPRNLRNSSYAVLGSKIYLIGGSIDGVRSSDVWVLDCRFHTWDRSPSLGLRRESPQTVVLDGKIYVIGGETPSCRKIDGRWVPLLRGSRLAEVFDPVTGNWEVLHVPLVNETMNFYHITKCAVIRGRVCIFFLRRRRGLGFDPKTKKWEECEPFGGILGFDEEDGEWKEVQGLKEVLQGFEYAECATNVGGRLALLWNEKVKSGTGEVEKVMWCGEIEVEKRGENDLWAKVHWAGKLELNRGRHFKWKSVSL
ncbi:hypothetical protein UlMin_038104 [Ulmus minor]